MSPTIARSVLWLVALLPSLVALSALPDGSFAGPATALNSLGRLTGIAGLGFFLVAAITSFRIPGVDKWFGGLTRLWGTHHTLGALAFLLLLLHPLLLALAMVSQSIGAAVHLLFPPVDAWAIWLGWAALLSMMIFLAPSFGFFGSPDYQRWKRLHKLSGIAALLALAHTFLLARSLPAPWDRIIWLALASATMASLVFGLVLARRGARYRYRVAAVAQPANNVVELQLAPLARSLRYQPGQFIYLTALDTTLAAGCGEEHPYTLSSAPAEPDLRVAIKDLGDASHALQTVRPGSEVCLSGPYGAFFPAPEAPPTAELWIAGGIGVAPFLGRLRHSVRQGDIVDVRMIFCVQDEARALFADELIRLAGQLPGFSLTLHYFYQQGPLSAAFVRHHCRDLTSRQVYVCGPAPLLALSKSLLLAAGLPRRQFHAEEFNLL